MRTKGRDGKRLFTIAAATLALAWAADLALAAASYRITQKGREFQQKQITLQRGDRLHFTNEDEFLHQIYIASPEFSFDSPEQAPGQAIDVEFTRAGTFEVRCHIHPKMLLTVTVN
jgi:plastocyanin